MSRTLVVGDVHACSAELRALVDEAAPDRLVMVGDLFTKGPDPLGTWALLQEVGAESVLGNHDAYVLSHRGRGAWGHLPEEALCWLAELPLVIQGDGWTVVHGGLHPQRGVEGTDRHTAIRVRRWPDDTSDFHPFWWQVYEGPGLVIYGHDARRGLVDRRPKTLGLDTGCVYGGCLTGFLVEEDRLLQVPAARVYKAPGT